MVFGLHGRWGLLEVCKTYSYRGWERFAHQASTFLRKYLCVCFVGCLSNARFNTNELQTEKKERSKQDLTAKIEDLESTIKSLTDAIDTLKSEVAEMQVQMKRAGEDREKENKEYVANHGSPFRHNAVLFCNSNWTVFLKH
jgi:outer membrane murein-binding lipoprotein Lpp